MSEQDDLRQRCEAFYQSMEQPMDKEAFLTILMAFARREQAQGMRDAAKYIRDLARSDAYQRHT